MNIFVSVFEPSADEITSQLIKHLQNHYEDIKILGFGGRKLREIGLIPFTREERIGHIYGFEDAFLAIREHWNYLRNMIKGSRTSRPPGIALLVDYPGFNLILASQLKKLGIPVIYYILPQVWAWWAFRAKFLRRYTDLAIGIYPFEPRFFKRYSLNVHFFGHPLVDTYNVSSLRDRRYSKDSVVGFFPGSRPSEVTSLMPLLREVAKQLIEHGVSRLLLSKHPSVNDENYGECNSFEIVTAPPVDWIQEIDFAIAASGTITLELALAGIPTIVVYRVRPITYLIARSIAQVPYISIANLILGEEVMPEVVQDIRPQDVVKAVLELMGDPQGYAVLNRKLLRVHSLLGPPGVLKRTAEFIHRWIQENFAL